jgi:di/tricarboxylate transporter
MAINMKAVVALSAFTLVILSLWATGLIAEYITALIFFTGAMLLAIAPPGIFFSGFSSGAFWLIFGGLILGVGINVTGLGTRIAVNGRRCAALSTGLLVVGRSGLVIGKS